MKKALTVSATIMLAMTAILSLSNNAYYYMHITVSNLLFMVFFTMLAIAVQTKSNKIAIVFTSIVLAHLISNFILQVIFKTNSHYNYNYTNTIILAFVYISSILFFILHKRIKLAPVKAIICAVPGLLYTVYSILSILENMSLYSKIHIEHQNNSNFFAYFILPLFQLLPKVISFYLITYAFAFDDTKDSESTKTVEERYEEELPVYPAAPVYSPMPAAPAFDTHKELKKIQALYSEQLISAKEYEEKRKQLLGI